MLCKKHNSVGSAVTKILSFRLTDERIDIVLLCIIGFVGLLEQFKLRVGNRKVILTILICLLDAYYTRKKDIVIKYNHNNMNIRLFQNKYYHNNMNIKLFQNKYYHNNMYIRLFQNKYYHKCILDCFKINTTINVIRLF